MRILIEHEKEKRESLQKKKREKLRIALKVAEAIAAWNYLFAFSNFLTARDDTRRRNSCDTRNKLIVV